MSDNLFSDIAYRELIAERDTEIERLRAALTTALKNGKEAPIDVDRWVELVAANQELRATLQEMPDLIKDFDGGNPETSTGWASEEMLDLWMRVRRALDGEKG
jgi:hypothetical protein